jgi:ABC-type multidrug transport system ATPase subunit
MLQARGLTKRYGGIVALDRVSFDIHPGEIVGYLGPNGSGKSTTVNLVVGLLEPSAGVLFLGGGAIPLHTSDGRRVPDARRPIARNR